MDHEWIECGPRGPEGTAARADRASSFRRASGRDDLAHFGLVSPGAEDGVRVTPRIWARLVATLKAATLVKDYYG